MKYPKYSLITALALGAFVPGSSFASAMPNGLPSTSAAVPAVEAPSYVENVRWVCGPYRCWWQPGPYGFYGPRPWGPGWGPGWRWHRWHYWRR
jgi:hypothetical protein